MKNKSLVLLSGEGNTIPVAEAKALFLTFDPSAEFDYPHPRILLARTTADPFQVGRRVAFARRVGLLLEDVKEAEGLLKGKRVRFRGFDLSGARSPADPESYLGGLDSTVDLASPDYEVSLVRADDDYLAITAPGMMKQGWSLRRPRSRSYFHPSAIFPKLSRALFNLSRCVDGGIFLDPFTGTGSIPIEASLCGAQVVAVDLSGEMSRGSLSNMKLYRQGWLGVVRADSTRTPVTAVDAIATDMPYGRASSARGRTPADLLQGLLPALGAVVSRSGRFVLMHPKDLPVHPTNGLAVEEEHHLHVHKLLTRTVSILRRT